MKTKTLFAIALICAGSALIYACKKSNSVGSSTTTTADVQTQADDEAQVSTESDDISDDVNTSLYSSVTVSGSSLGTVEGSGRLTTMGITRVDGTVTDSTYTGLICDATIAVKDSAGIRTVTITYDGTNCAGNRTRTGTVVITLPTGAFWRDAGATVSIAINNLKITRLSDNKVITINGTKTITNVSGGLLIDLANSGPITHTITGALSVTFPNGATRTWNESKQRVFSYNDGIVITTTGTHTDSQNNTDVAEWGTDRFGTSFESLISEPKVFSQSCSFALTSGQNTVLSSDGVQAILTYGLDSSGNPTTTCPLPNGFYYYKLVVTLANGKVYTFIAPYW